MTAEEARILAAECDDTILNSSHEDDVGIIARYLEAAAKTTAARCVEICDRESSEEAGGDCAAAIKKEFGLE